MNEITQLYRSFTLGFAIITFAALLGSAWTCLAHRRLSSWLIAVAIALVGESLATAIGQFAAVLAPENSYMVSRSPEVFFVFDLLAQFVRLVSTVVLVLGLVASLAEIRGKLAVSMEPKHGRV